MKKVLTTILIIAATTGAAIRISNHVSPTAIYQATIEKAAPIKECYSVKLDRETREVITTTYAC